MEFVRNRLTAVSVFAALALSGCASYPEETKVNYGPGKIVVVSRQYVCYWDAQIIDGKRTGVNLCGRSHSGFSFDDQPQIWAGLGNRMPPQFQLSDAIAGTKVPLKGHVGFLKCDPLNQTSSSKPRVTFCKLTLNDQLLISAEVVFEAGSDTRMNDKPNPISALIEAVRKP
ncbi:hypothetical protein [Pseudomonas ogarae]|uniref:hypothetical protein n=1 Tax=Pseudomonas ogarae (strain DSM 112162 / CECT 30235 / F113) TaxID=1114970 RepID=UPI00194F4584|nr:hypothetical protein [Pseudomonas ogarae]